MWTQYPGKVGKAYKTMRLRFGRSNGGWPMIQEDSLQRWRVEGAETIWPLDPPEGAAKPRREGATFLKAFRGSPCWTTQDVDKFCKAFKANAITCSNLPVAFHLRTAGPR